MNAIDWRTRKSKLFNDYIQALFFILFSNELFLFFLPCSSFEGSFIHISDQGLRKVLYQKVSLYIYIQHGTFNSRRCALQIVAAFPEGWMSSGQISRDVNLSFSKFLIVEDLVSAMKKKLEKEAMEQEIDEQTTMLCFGFGFGFGFGRGFFSFLDVCGLSLSFSFAFFFFFFSLSS